MNINGIEFQKFDTGGGCTAWFKQLGAAYLLVTDDNANAPDSIEECTMVGLYDDRTGMDILLLSSRPSTVKQIEKAVRVFIKYADHNGYTDI